MSVPVLPLPLARTDTANNFSESQTFSGSYNAVENGLLQFMRDGLTTPLVGLRWFVKNDSDKNEDGSEHYYGWLADWGGYGGYLAFYDSRLDKDIMQIGVHGAQAGRFAFGVDLINPRVQVQVHDFPEVDWSISTWSENGGIALRSKAASADCVSVTREDTPEKHWFHLQQGNTTHDWRFGFEPGSYDLVFCNPNGSTSSSADAPGEVRFRIKGNGEIVSPTIEALHSRISTLEKLMLQKQQPQEPQ